MKYLGCRFALKGRRAPMTWGTQLDPGIPLIPKFRQDRLRDEGAMLQTDGRTDRHTDTQTDRRTDITKIRVT